MIGWDPGFDGGYKQTFTLEMKQLDPLTARVIHGSVLKYDISGNTDLLLRRRRSLAAVYGSLRKNITGTMVCAQLDDTEVLLL